jgi:predicted MFS family arabinose efflux permease
MSKEIKPVSYWFAIALALGVAVTTGYGRFAYALILPLMRLDLGWNYAMAGLPNTWNAIGNVVGALIALVALRKIEPRWVFITGLLLTSSSLLLTGISHNLELISLMRFLAGVGASAAFASGGALVAKCFESSPERSGTAIAIYFGGGGFGIALSSLTMPALDSYLGASGWPYSWFLLGVLAIASAIAPIAIALRIRIRHTGGVRAAYSLKSSWAMLLSYALFGGGYIVYLTFSFAWMRENHVSVVGSSFVWVLLGIAIMFSPWVWRYPMTHWYPSKVLAFCAFVTCIAGVLPLVSSNYALVALSAILFGGSFFIAPSSITAFTRRHFPVAAWAPIITIFTVLFSALQAGSPLIAGAVADMYGLELGFVLGSGVLMASCLAALAQRKLD